MYWPWRGGGTKQTQEATGEHTWVDPRHRAYMVLEMRGAHD